MLQRVVGAGLLYHLYTNDVEPGLSDTLDSYTPAAWSGYAPILVPAVAWTIEGVSAHVGNLQAAAILFRNTSPGLVVVFGFYATDDTGMQLVCAGRFDAAPVTIAVGATYPVTPLLGSYSGLSS